MNILDAKVKWLLAKIALLCRKKAILAALGVVSPSLETEIAVLINAVRIIEGK